MADNPQLARVLEAMKAAGMKRGSGEDWQCPAHDDDGPSLGIAAGDSQPVVFKCQAGCSTPAILKALDLRWSDVMNGKPPKPKLLRTRQWEYVDADSVPILDVYRYDFEAPAPKRFAQYAAGTKVKGSAKSVPRVLFDLPAVLRVARAGGVVHVTEGEVCSDALQDHLIALGIGGSEVATTMFGGASQDWPQSATDSLTGARLVVVHADDDLAGWLRADAVASALKAAGLRVQIKRPGTGELGSKRDIADHLADGLGLDSLRPLKAADIATARGAAEESGAISVDRLWSSPSQPLLVANEYLDRFWTVDRQRTLWRWREGFYGWTGSRYRELPPEELRKHIYDALASAEYGGAEGVVLSWSPDSNKITKVIDALKAASWLSDSVEDGHWLDLRQDGSQRRLAFANGVLTLGAERVLVDCSPAYWNLAALPYEYPKNGAPRPERWLSFLEQVWKDDVESIELLREWFGYVLGGRNDLEKLLFLIGKRRSGKSTIVKVLTALLGAENVVGSSLNALADRFGLIPYIGKLLSIPGDVRLGSKDRAVIVERINSISGNDPVSIERKGKNEWWTGILPTRFMVVSNDTPDLRDDSGALAVRTLYLTTSESFEDRADTALFSKLEAELPGILLWALEGHAKVYWRGGFTHVTSVEDDVASMRDMGSPALHFFRDNLEEKFGVRVSLDDVYARYLQWAQGEGMSYTETKTVFAKSLASATQYKAREAKRDGSRFREYRGLQLRTHRTQV